jgi:anti-sigma-K factor RskA
VIAIAALLLAAALQAAAPTPAAMPLPFDELPPQTLAPQSCAMFLWDRASRRRIIMATAAPAALRVVIAGKPVQLAAAQPATGAMVMGFAAHSSFGDAALNVTLDLALVASEGGGAVIRDGIVTVARAGADTVVAPVAGLVGCRA